MIQPITIQSRGNWDDLLLSLPTPHLLQCWRWGDLKRSFGWRARRIAWRGGDGSTVAAAQLLNRRLRAPLPGGGPCLEYCPKGPVLDWSEAGVRRQALPALIAAARESGAFVLKIDPEVAYRDGDEQHPDAAELNPPSPLTGGPGEAVESELRESGWLRSADRTQFRNTLMLDLRKDEDTLLAEMKQKWRYNVRLARRKGVRVRRGGVDDLDLLYRMYAQTAARDGFVIRTRDYYRRAWGSFTEAGLAQPLIAEFDGRPIAGQVVYRFGRTGWYLFGMSTDAHRELMPNHLLHWEAIRWAKQHGCEVYDFVGAPDELQESDPMWGVYRFKLGFGGELVRTIGEWDYPLRPALYWAYRLLWPRVLVVMRLFGRRRVAVEAAD